MKRKITMVSVVAGFALLVAVGFVFADGTHYTHNPFGDVWFWSHNVNDVFIIDVDGTQFETDDEIYMYLHCCPKRDRISLMTRLS